METALNWVFRSPEGAQEYTYRAHLEEAGKNVAGDDYPCIAAAYKNTVLGTAASITLFFNVIGHILVGAVWNTITLIARCQFSNAGLNFLKSFGYSALALIRLIAMPFVILAGLVCPQTVWGAVAKAANSPSPAPIANPDIPNVAALQAELIANKAAVAELTEESEGLQLEIEQREAIIERLQGEIRRAALPDIGQEAQEEPYSPAAPSENSLESSEEVEAFNQDAGVLDSPAGEKAPDLPPRPESKTPTPPKSPQAQSEKKAD